MENLGISSVAAITVITYLMGTGLHQAAKQLSKEAGGDA